MVPLFLSSEQPGHSCSLIFSLPKLVWISRSQLWDYERCIEMTWWSTDKVFCISLKCQDLFVANNFESFKSAPMSSSHRFSKIILLKTIVPLLTVTLYFLMLIYCFHRTYPLSRSCLLLVSLLQCNMYEDRDHISVWFHSTFHPQFLLWYIADAQ